MPTPALHFALPFLLIVVVGAGTPFPDDRSSPSVAGVTAHLPEADAYVRGGTYAEENFGSVETLYVKDAGVGDYTREAYLRFDLSGISGSVNGATLRLHPYETGASGQTHAVALVAEDGWTVGGLTWNSRPARGSELASWTVSAGQAAEVDLTTAAAAEASGDGRLSLVVYSLSGNGGGSNW